MSRAAQNLLMLVLGGAVLWITVATDEYLNYVRPGFRYVLVPAAVVLVALGLVGLWRERGADDPGWATDSATGAGAGTADDAATGTATGHAHAPGHGPRVAWLLCLPALAIFVIAPPALGSFMVTREAERTPPPTPNAVESYPPLPTTGPPTPMTLTEFINRSYVAQTRDPASLRDRPVKLTGFVMPREEGGWLLTRLRISCCAGDALPLQVVIRSDGRRPPTESWVEVEGTWIPHIDPKHIRYEIDADRVRPVKKPKNPYEG